MHLFGRLIDKTCQTAPHSTPLSPLSVPDCAVCAEGFAPGVAYSCRECSGDTRRSAVGITIAVALTALLVAALLFGHLGHVVHDEAGEEREAARGVWGKKWWSCLFSLGNMLPLTAIKIVVTVWQILYQVQGGGWVVRIT